MGSAEGQSIPRAWPFKGVYYGWAIVLVGLISGFASSCMFGPVLAVFVKPIGDELGWSRADIAVAFSAGTAIGSFSSAGVGPLVDRHGTRLIFVVAGLLMAAAMVLIAVMTEPWQFWVGVGIGRGGATAGVLFSNAVNMARWFIRMRARAQAIASSGLRLGQVVLPILIYAVMEAAGWRLAFLLLGILILVGVACTGAVYLRSHPEALGLLPDGDVAAKPSGGDSVPRPVFRDVEAQWSLREATRTRTFWLLVVGVAGIFLVNGAVNLHAVAHFQDRGMPAGLAVTIVMIFAVSTVVAALGWGFVVERVHVRWAATGTALTFLIALGSLVQADSYPAAVLFGILFGAASGGLTTVERLLIPNYFGRFSAGVIGGVKEVVVGCISPFGPIIAGLVRDATGSYIPAFVGFGGVALFAMVAMALASPPRQFAQLRP